jgi:hypothetical protein
LDAADQARSKRFGAKTETIELALDLVISEHRRNRFAWEANHRFVRSGVEIKDVSGKLE